MITWLTHFCRVLHLALLYLGSLAVLLAYSLLYGLTANEEHWLGAITSSAVIVLGMETYIEFMYAKLRQFRSYISKCFSFAGVRLEYGSVLAGV